MDKKILGAILPGNSTVELKEFDIPKPGHGQVLVKTKASTICGSDIRCIYRAHVGKGPEGYQPGMIAGHEPCGIIVDEALQEGRPRDRVPHLRLRRLLRLPARLLHLLQEPLPRGIRLAAQRRHGPLHAVRREGPDRPARRADL